jgi:hypothetical protein
MAMAEPRRMSGANLIAMLVALIGGGALLFWFVVRPLFVP